MRPLGSEHTDVAGSLVSLAELLAQTGRILEAEKLARESLRIRTKVLPAGHPDAAASKGCLGSCLAKQSHFDEAEPLLLHANEILSAKEPQRRRTKENREELVALYEAWGKPEKAAAYRQPGK